MLVLAISTRGNPLNYRAATLSEAALWLACATIVCADDGPSPAPAAATEAATATEAAAAAAAAAEPELEPADAIVCRYERPIGSHLRIKVCRTRAQIRAAEEEKQRAMNEARSRGHQQNASGG